MAKLHRPPSKEEYRATRNVARLRTNVPLDLKDAVLAKQAITGMPVAEMLRRAARLWVTGALDELIGTPEARGEERARG